MLFLSIRALDTSYYGMIYKEVIYYDTVYDFSRNCGIAAGGCDIYGRHRRIDIDNPSSGLDCVRGGDCSHNKMDF